VVDFHLGQQYDATVFHHQRGEHFETGLIQSLVNDKPLCFISGGSYSADVAGSELEARGRADFVWLSSIHPLERSPIQHFGPRSFYNWLAAQTPEMLVQGFSYSGSPANELSVGRIRIGHDWLEVLRGDPESLYRLTPAQFEEVVCDRLDAMGYEPSRVGSTNTPDGGVDIVAVQRDAPFPVLLAVQVKHRLLGGSVGPAAVRELEGIVSRDSFSLGVLVTNANFTPDARWVADARRTMLRLRDHDDVMAWLHDSFRRGGRRELPDVVTLRPGLQVQVPWPGA
jgi:hypothetical protein